MEFKEIALVVSYLWLMFPGLVSCQDRNVMTLESGGYSNILIAIDTNVPEDPSIITNLQVNMTTEQLLLLAVPLRENYFCF